MNKIVIYNDLTTKEYKEIQPEALINAIGIISKQESDISFYPNYFGKSRKGSSVKLFDWQILENTIYFNKFFTITKLKELPDDNLNRYFYKLIEITLTDHLNSSITFKFYIDPNEEISYLKIYEYLLNIKTSLGDSETSGMYKLQGVINDKNKEIENLNKLILELKGIISNQK